MAIISDSPVIVPEVITPAKVYNIWWVTEMDVSAPNPSYGSAVKATLTFRLACRDENGIGEFHPTEPPRTITFNDLFAEAQTLAADLAGSLDVAMTTLGAMAKKAGTLT